MSVDGNAATESGDDVPSWSSPDYGIPFECYLNIYHGLDVDPDKIDHFTSMTSDQKRVHEAFARRVREFDFDQRNEGGGEGTTTTTTTTRSYANVTPDDMTCLRFLQADKYDPDKAFDRISATLEWGRNIDLARTVSVRPPELETYRRIRVRARMGRTVDGMPIFVERLGGFMNGIPSKEGRSLDNEQWVRCFLYDLGDVIRSVRESYEHTTSIAPEQPTTWRACWIMDFKGVSYVRAAKAVSVIKLLDALAEPNFPELAGPVYLVNVPKLVMGVWRIIRAFLDPTTLEKIQLFSGVPKDVLAKRIPESVLFTEFGGTNTAEYPRSEYVT